MAFSQLQLTNAGTRELAKGQVLTLTKVALGDAQVANVATATNLARKVCEVVPTATADGDYHVIEAVFDNVALNITAEKQIQEVGVFGKVGNGSEALIYYAKGNAFVFPSKTQQQMTVKLPLRVKITGAPEVKVEINTQLSGMATADSVNRVSATLGKLKTGSGDELSSVLDIEKVKALMRYTKRVRAPQDIDTLGTPGLYFYEDSHKLSNKGIYSGYGFIDVYSNGVGTLGQNGNWTWQIITGTNGRHWTRIRINSDPWKVVDLPSQLFQRLGLDEWGLNAAPKVCPSGTKFEDYLKTNNVPPGFSIIRDMNQPVKEVFVWKPSNTYVYCFAPHWDGAFYVASLTNNVWKPWTDLSRATRVYSSSNNQDFGDYLKSDAVPVGVSTQKDAKSGAFGTATKVDNNNVMFQGTLAKGGKTYMVVLSIVNGKKPSTFTEWALTD